MPSSTDLEHVKGELVSGRVGGFKRQHQAGLQALTTSHCVGYSGTLQARGCQTDTRHHQHMSSQVSNILRLDKQTSHQWLGIAEHVVLQELVQLIEAVVGDQLLDDQLVQIIL